MHGQSDLVLIYKMHKNAPNINNPANCVKLKL